TINLDDDVLETARAIAHAERRPLGLVISMLARRGLRPHQGGNRDSEEGGFPVFSVDANAAPITPEMVQRALDEA
ncbi:MAG: hypothetical protein J2P57_25605, partial [Acidimicrobiaceae bacterium]|nr:hypothetical protein [Acidimicrobiaceae bacterium]